MNPLLIAHLTDPHQFFAGPSLVEALSKRGLAYINWLRRRRRLHRPEITARIVSDLKSAQADYIVMTGDLVNFGLEAEFAAGAGWLAELGPPGRVGVVPGNHEALVRDCRAPLLRHWGPYVSGDDGRAGGRAGFPWVRRRDGVALIGLSSAVPAPPLFASGTVGPAQREALGRILAETGRAGLCRVVLVHHPPTPVTVWRKRLIDGPALCEVIARHGAELVLHGHTHRAELSWIGAGAARVPVLGAPACGMRPGPGRDAGAWFAIALERAAGGWRIALAERRVDGSGEPVDGVRLTLELARPALARLHAAP